MYVADVAQIPRCCGCGVGPVAAAPIGPLGWECPFAAGASLKRQRQKKKKERKKKKENVGIPQCSTGKTAK